MNNRKLIITWKPDVLHMGTARSERDSFKNIKTIEKAQKIVSKRNPHQILFATYNNEVIFSSTN